MIPNRYQTYSSGFKKIGYRNVLLCTTTLPPIEHFVLAKPLVSLHNDKDIDVEHNLSFISSRNHSLIYFHRAHRRQRDPCICDGEENGKCFFNIVTQHFFNPAYQQTVRLKNAKVGRKKLLFSMEKTIRRERLDGGKGWKPKKLMEIVDKQRHHLEKSSLLEFYRRRYRNAQGLVTGCYLFKPESTEEYLREKKLTNSLLFSR